MAFVDRSIWPALVSALEADVEAKTASRRQKTD